MELVFPLLILFMIGLLFVSSRQRKKQAQQHDELTNSLAVGDVVVMTSGISGTIVDVDDEKTVDVEIAEDVVTTWLRAAVREKLVEETADGASDPGVDADAIVAADAPADESVGGTPTRATPTGAPTATGSTPDLTKSAESPASSGSSRTS